MQPTPARVALAIDEMDQEVRLRRRNRVHPKVASPAPLRWLVMPSTPARLHRRLRKQWPALQKQYRDALPTLVSQESWAKTFEEQA